MDTDGKRNDSWAQRREAEENRVRERKDGTGGKASPGIEPGIDKKLNGPNRPAE